MNLLEYITIAITVFFPLPVFFMAMNIIYVLLKALKLLALKQAVAIETEEIVEMVLSTLKEAQDSIKQSLILGTAYLLTLIVGSTILYIY